MGSNVIPLSSNEKSCFLCKDTTDYHLHKCKNPDCEHWHCIEHSSKADPQYCENCIVDVTVTEESFQRVVEDYDEKTDKITITKTAPIKKISFSGADWTFLNEAIRSQSDEELKVTVQVYRAAVSAMEAEITARKVKQITNIRVNGIVVSQKVTTVKTVKTTRAAKTPDLNAMAEKLKALNLTAEQLKMILGN